MRYGEDIAYDKGDAENHRSHQDRKPWRNAHDFYVAKVIPRFDVPKQVEDGEDPPWIAEQGLVRSCMHEQIALVAEVQELRVALVMAVGTKGCQ